MGATEGEPLRTLTDPRGVDGDLYQDFYPSSLVMASRAQDSASELGTSVGRPGLDPGTLGLKVPCSTR